MRVNLYLNDDDYIKWQAIKNKSAFVSNALGVAPKNISPPLKEKGVPEKIETIGLCKNGHITNSFTGRCSQKDCKYG